MKILLHLMAVAALAVCAATAQNIAALKEEASN
jgi:hypothetical protein